MNREDKNILFKDLCARLPYGVKLQKFNEPDSVFELYSFNKESGVIMFYKYKGKALTIGDVGKLYRRDVLLYKPFLRSMSSMTEEEKTEYGNIAPGIEWNYGIHFPTTNKIDWLNAHHFDYRGLIEKGLAIEAPKGMYE